MKKLIALLLASVMMIVAAGCGGGGEQAKDNGKSGGGDKKITMGFSQIGAESEWRTANTESIKQAAQGCRHQPPVLRCSAEAGEPDQGHPFLHRPGR